MAGGLILRLAVVVVGVAIEKDANASVLGVGLSNYVTALTDQLFWQTTAITVLYMVVTVAIELVIGFIFAMVMHRVIFARGVIRTSILIPYGIITVVSAFAWQFAFSLNNGFVNSWFSWLPWIAEDTNWFGDHWPAMFAIMVSEIWKTTPFMSLLLLAGLSQVSEDMVEAAKVDPPTRLEVQDGFGDSEGNPDPEMPTGLMVVTLTENEGGTPLPMWSGLAVHTVGKPGKAYYAVVATDEKLGPDISLQQTRHGPFECSSPNWSRKGGFVKPIAASPPPSRGRPRAARWRRRTTSPLSHGRRPARSGSG